MNKNKFHGKGKLYNAKGTLIYEGDFKEDFAEGIGTQYLTGKKIVGEFSNGKANGNCILSDLYNSIIFKGIYKDGQAYKGIIYNFGNKKEYEGFIKNNKYDGYGIEYYTYNGNKKYEGNFKEGKFHGIGKEYESDGKTIREGEYYKGQFIKGFVLDYHYSYKNDKEFDYSLVKKDIESEKDIFSQYYKLSKEIHYDKNGKKIFEGKTYAGSYDHGKLYNNRGYLIYDGYFKDNQYRTGKLYRGYGDDNKMIYEGEFVNGKYHGQGREYDEKYGILEYEGGFSNGERHGFGKLYPGAKSVHYINGIPE